MVLGICVYSLQGNQAVGRKVTLLQTSTIRKMSPTRRTLRIWMVLCREWNLRRLLLLLPQGVITAAIKNERIKTATGQWQGPPPIPHILPTPQPTPTGPKLPWPLLWRDFTRIHILWGWFSASVAVGKKFHWSKWNANFSLKGRVGRH